ncbi:MAG: hypothetical protein ACE5JA_08405 [bacterium]
MFRQTRTIVLLALLIFSWVISSVSVAVARTAAPQVSLGAHGELQVNGQPFLPIFVWLQPIRNFDFLISLGINTFMGEGAQGETAKEFLDAAQARGVWGIIHRQKEKWQLKNHPALLCWMFGDEPDLPAKQPDKGQAKVPRVSPEEVAKQYRALKAVDVDHPVYLNLTAGFYEQFARYDEETYRRYCQATDIVGYDLYPVTGWGKPEWVPLIGPATRKLRTLAGPRVPVWVILECTTKLRWVSQEKLNRIGHPQGARDFELRAMVWLAIVNGAKGIGYFPHRWEPYKQADISEEVQAEMRRTNRQLTELASIILSPDAPEQVRCEAVNGRPVDILAKKYQGNLHLFAVNATREPVNVQFALPPAVRVSEVEVYDEQRKIAVQKGRFEDSFPELGVRIYVVPIDSVGESEEAR